MSNAFKLSGKLSGGKQSVEAFEEGPRQTLSITKSGGGEEPGALTASLTNKNEEKLEIQAFAH